MTNKWILRVCKPVTLIWALVASAGMATVLTCSFTSGTSVFNVFDGGSVTLNATDNNSNYPCHITFGSGSATINVSSSNLSKPSMAGYECPVTTPTTPTSITKLTLPAQPTYPTAIDLNVQNINWDGSGNVLSNFTINDVTYRSCTRGGATGWINTATCNESSTFVTTAEGALKLPTIGTNEYFTLLKDVRSLTGYIYPRSPAPNDLGTFGIRVDIPDGITIDTIDLGAQSRLRLFGQLRIKTLRLADFFQINVATGVSKARIYANTFVIPKGNQSCINIVDTCPASISPATAQSVIDKQNAKRLTIFVYSGDFKFPDTAQIAAGVYVENGNFEISTGNYGTLFVGEIFANKIQMPNSQTTLSFQDTGEFGQLIKNGDGRQTIDIPAIGFFSPARPAMPTSARTGDLAFLVYQQDQSTLTPTVQYNQGTLKAFALTATGATSTTATWDANDRATTNGGAGHRQSRLYSNSAPDDSSMGDLSLIKGDAVLDSAAEDRLINGPGLTLPTTWLGFYGKPGDLKVGSSTAPQIAGDLVLFATSDGFLYALDKATGNLRWGWMPHVLRTEFSTLDTYTASIQSAAHVMQGQLSVATVSGVTYVLGSVQQGRLHFSLRLKANGDLDKVVWLDQRSATAASTHSVEAPAIMGTKCLYLTNDHRLIVRDIAAAGAPVTDITTNPDSAVPTNTIASAPTLIANTSGGYTLYVGDSVGDVWTATVSATGTMATDPWTRLGTSPALLTATPVKYVIYTQTSEAEYLTLQSSVRITTLKGVVTTSSGVSTTAWREIWTSTQNDSKQWTWSGASKTEVTGTAKVISPIDSIGKITDRSTTVGGFILTPVTLDPTGTISCLGEARLYIFPLDPEVPLYKVFYNSSELTDSYVMIGFGTALQAKPLILNGTLMAQGHSSQNTIAGTQGLDNPLAFRPIAPNTGPGRRSWREITLN